MSIKLGMVDKKNLKSHSDDGIIPFILTTKTVDRDSEVVLPKGAIVDSFKNNPVFVWVHDIRNKAPIGKLLVDTFKITEESFTSDVQFDITKDSNGDFNDPFAAMIYSKYKNGFLNAGSIRFQTKEIGDPILDGQKGATIKRWELLEFSGVPVPSNPEALAASVKSIQTEGQILDIEKSLMDEISKYTNSDDWLKEMDKDNQIDIHYIKGFDIVDQKIDPVNLQYDWASKYCDCDVKELFVTSTSFGGLWKGSIFDQYEKSVKEWVIEDVRNLTERGTELPPHYDSIQLNSKEAGVYLVDGTQFIKTNEGFNIICEFNKGWGTQILTIYCSNKNKDFATNLIDKLWREAKENHKMKGESFSLSGNFIEKNPKHTFEKVFLLDKNKDALIRMVHELNAKGSDYPNRGLIFMGPPGTGKTFSGRIIMNQVKEGTTFIWVSAKDFYNYGTSRGLIDAFATAKLLSPSVLLFEDADNWINGGLALDLIKTEMDGLDQSSGLVTIIATNYPDRMPDSLIDRPGRFHDILEFNLPVKSIRLKMLCAWLNDDLNISKVDDNIALEKFAKETEGFSGAHIYEFVEFSKLLKEESGSNITEAMSKALSKIKEQRELINSDQLSGATYRRIVKQIYGSVDFDNIVDKMQKLLSGDKEYHAGIRKMVYYSLCESYKKEGKQAPGFRKGDFKVLEPEQRPDSHEELPNDKELIIKLAAEVAKRIIEKEN